MATIYLNYSENSHALVGDFKEKYAECRTENFSRNPVINYNSKLYVGCGWTLRKEKLDWLKDILRKYEIEFEEKNFDPAIRKEKIKERRRAAYKKRTEKKKITPNVNLALDISSSNIRFISDRQDLLEDIKSRRAGLAAYMFDRIDMYWIQVNDARYSIEPYWRTSNVGWTLNLQYGVSNKESESLATEVFKLSVESKNQEKWIKNLADAGYFEDGVWPGKDTYKCDRCGSTYKNGSTHEHIKLDNGRIVPHQYRQYKKIIDAGFKCSWLPAGKDQPSIEELEN
jgi:hypothetical protein